MTEEDKQRGLELQGYIFSIENMTLKEIAIKYLKKYHLPKFLFFNLVRFAYPLLVGIQYRYEKHIADLEKEKCELLGIIQGKDKAIQDLQKENAELRRCVLCSKLAKLERENNGLSDNLTKVKKLLNEFMRISKACDEDFEHDYSELIAEAEQFLNSEVEK